MILKKIVYGIIGFIVYCAWLVGLGALLVGLYGASIVSTQIPPALVYAISGGMHVGIIYAIWCALDFTFYFARKSE